MEKYRYSGKIRPGEALVKTLVKTLPAIFDVLFIVCDRYTHKFWVFVGHVTGRCQGLFPSHLQSQGKVPWLVATTTFSYFFVQFLLPLTQRADRK